jgi:23S rRNA pseudouridine2605 synthase
LTPINKNVETLRLNRYLAQCGLGSRRKADELINTGHVYVNGKRVTEMGVKVLPGRDIIEYHGKQVKPIRNLAYYAYNKPVNVIVTKNDPQKRETVYDALKKKKIDVEHLNYVGRLDYNSEGLLLLTNDGDLIHSVTHPRFKIKKVYRVKIMKRLSSEEINMLICGIESDGQILHAASVRDVSQPASERKQFWYEIELFEGKNRQIRRMMKELGVGISRLRRIQFGSVKLNNLVSGDIRTLTEKEVAALKSCGYKR